MKKKSVLGYAIVFCFLIFAQTSSAANQTKVWVGAGLIAGGVGLGAHAASNAFCGGFDIFPPSDPDVSRSCGQEKEMIAGVVMIGVGTFFLINGLRDDDAGASEKKINPLNRSLLIHAGPVKKGWAGAVRIRW